MATITDKIIEYINNNVSVDVIKNELNLSNKQLMYYFRLIGNRGYNLTKRYYNDGSVLFDYDKYDTKGIYIEENEKKLRCMVISDLHFFHKYDSQKSIESIFDYCVKNNIKVILLCGDIINSMYGDNISIENEASEFINLYPSDKSINTFCVLGNHDYNYLKNTNIDLKKYINDRRYDMLVLGYKECSLGMKKDYIIMRHFIKDFLDTDDIKENNCCNKIVISGHSHFYKTKGNIIKVPTLSNVTTYNKVNDISYTPQALDMTFSFEDNVIDTVDTYHLLVDDKCVVIGENIIKLDNHGKQGDQCFNVSEYPTRILK